MIKELYMGIYEAIGRKDIPLMRPDLLEPKDRPGLKIYIKPNSSRLNQNVRFTDYDILILYYARDINNYYIEHFEIEEEFDEMLLGCIELPNGVFIELDEIDYTAYDDMLEIRTSTTVDTYVDTELDDEIMEELELYFKN